MFSTNLDFILPKWFRPIYFSFSDLISIRFKENNFLLTFRRACLGFEGEGTLLT